MKVKVPFISFPQRAEDHSISLAFEFLYLVFHKCFSDAGIAADDVDELHGSNVNIADSSCAQERLAMSAPAVTIVIPTRNRLAFLKEAVASVRAQSHQDFELVVVNDASEDGTAHWLADQHDLLCIHSERPLLTGAARNRGIEVARGDFIWFLDDDDRLFPDAIRELIAIERYPEVVGAVGARIRFREGQYAVRIRHPRRSRVRYVWREALAEWNPVPSQILYRTATVHRLGGFRTDLEGSEDRDFFARASLLGPVLLRPRPVAEYRVHRGNMPKGSSARPFRDRALDPLVDQTAESRRGEAIRLRRAARLWVAAEDAFDDSRFSEAIRLYARVCVTAPSLMTSPIARPMIVHKTLRSLDLKLLGGRGYEEARRLKRTLRRLLLGLPATVD